MLLGFAAAASGSCSRTSRPWPAAATGLDPAVILAALSQREKLGTTGIGEGIAIPHARVKQLTGMTGFFARLATPVDYDALDDAPVDLVFLLLAPEEANTVQLKALARIARLLRDPEVCARLRREPEPGRLRPAGRPGAGPAREPTQRRRPRIPPARLGGGLVRPRRPAARRPGAGKSALLARLLAAGAYLVADDLVQLSAVARCCARGSRRDGLDRAARQRHLPRRHCLRGSREPLCRPAAAARARAAAREWRDVALAGRVPLLRLAGGTPAAGANPAGPLPPAGRTEPHGRGRGRDGHVRRRAHHLPEDPRGPRLRGRRQPAGQPAGPHPARTTPPAPTGWRSGSTAARAASRRSGSSGAGTRPRAGVRARLLFLECDDEVLRRRFTETRRRHPLADLPGSATRLRPSAC